MDAVGTRGFSAPEQLEGRGVDSRADIFALARVLERMLGIDASQKVGSDLEALAAVIRRATSRSPDARPATVEEFEAAVLNADRDLDRWGPLAAGSVVGASRVIRAMGRHAHLWFYEVSLPQCASATMLVTSTEEGRG